MTLSKLFSSAFVISTSQGGLLKESSKTILSLVCKGHTLSQVYPLSYKEEVGKVVEYFIYIY